MLAHFSQDPALLAAFRDDRDIHAAVASRIFHVAEAQVSDDQRRVAKTVNFGVDLRDQTVRAGVATGDLPKRGRRRSSSRTSRNTRVSTPLSRGRSKRRNKPDGWRRFWAVAGRSTGSRTRPATSATSRSAPRSTRSFKGRRPTSSSARCSPSIVISNGTSSQRAVVVADPRRTRVRVPRGGSRDAVAVGAHGDDHRAGAGCPVESRPGRRAQLARRGGFALRIMKKRGIVRNGLQTEPK